MLSQEFEDMRDRYHRDEITYEQMAQWFIEHGTMSEYVTFHIRLHERSDEWWEKTFGISDFRSTLDGTNLETWISSIADKLTNLGFTIKQVEETEDGMDFDKSFEPWPASINKEVFKAFDQWRDNRRKERDN
jgi:hypothetical protein